MLRAARTCISLAFVISLTSAVQAQQSASKTKVTEAKPPVAPVASVPAKPPAPVNKPSNSAATKIQPLTPAAKQETKAEAKSTSSKTEAKVEAKSSSAKTEANAGAKSAKPDARVEAKSTSTKPDAKAEAKSTSTKPEAKVEPSSKPGAKATPASAKNEVGPKTVGKANDGKHTPVHEHPRLGLVPPPPPDTPTILPNGEMIPGLGGLSDYTNPAALAQRRKDISAQLAAAQKVLLDKQQRAADYKTKIEQFDSLYAEGVISRKELENTKKEAESTSVDLNDAKTQVASLQNTLARINDRLKPKAVASSTKNKKKKGKEKLSAAAGSGVKPGAKSTESVAQPKPALAKDHAQPDKPAGAAKKDATPTSAEPKSAPQASPK